MNHINYILIRDEKVFDCSESCKTPHVLEIYAQKKPLLIQDIFSDYFSSFEVTKLFSLEGKSIDGGYLRDIRSSTNLTYVYDLTFLDKVRRCLEGVPHLDSIEWILINNSLDTNITILFEAVSHVDENFTYSFLWKMHDKYSLVVSLLKDKETNILLWSSAKKQLELPTTVPLTEETLAKFPKFDLSKKGTGLYENIIHFTKNTSLNNARNKEYKQLLGTTNNALSS